MYCKKCGQEIDKNSKFCRHCGTSVSRKTKRKTYRIFFAIAVLYLFSLPTSAKSSIVAVIINLAFVAGFVYLGVKGYRASKTQEYPVQSLTTVHDKQSNSNPEDIGPEDDHSAKVSIPTSGWMKKTHRVAGVSFYQDNIMKLAWENSDYDMTKKEIVEDDLTGEKIWKYKFSPRKTELIPEPDNPKDPNAIKVMVDGLHVGYIKSGSCSHVLNVLRDGRCMGIDCEIYGGPYKIVYEEYDYDKDRNAYTLEKEERSFAIELTMYEKAK